MVVKAKIVNRRYGHEKLEILINAETKKELSNEQVKQLFQKLEITGVYVVLRYSNSKDKLLGPPDAPFIGLISNITDDTVYLGSYAVPRKYFLKWYELD